MNIKKNAKSLRSNLKKIIISVMPKKNLIQYLYHTKERHECICLKI